VGARNGQPANGQGNGRPSADGQQAANAPQGGSAYQRGGGDVGAGSGSGGRGNFSNMTPEERQKRMQERLAQMTPEQRQQFEARMKERGVNMGGQNDQPAARPQNAKAPQSTESRAMASGAQSIDALFGPLPTVESRGRVWLYINKQLKPVNLRLGISDGTWTEVLDGNELQPGTDVVTNVTTGLETQQRPGNQNPGSGNPLMGPQRGGPGRGR